MAGKRCCCGCCSVRDGTKIIGIMCVVFGTLYIVFGIYCFGVLSQNPRALVDLVYFYMDPVKREEIVKFITDHLAATYGYLAGVIFTIALNVVFGSMLLYGVYKNDKSKCKPFLYYNGFFLVVAAILSIIVVIIQLYVGQVLAAISSLIFVTVTLLFEAYILKVVYDGMQELDEVKRGSSDGHPYKLAA